MPPGAEQVQPPLVAANWKMHGDRTRLTRWAAALAAGGLPDAVEVALFPPFVLLPRAEECASQEDSAPSTGAPASPPRTPSASSFAWGGQTLSAEAEGACTGEVSAAMLAACGCRYVLVGHSERRRRWGEDDAAVAAQFCRALDAGLQPILCLGESREQRETGQTFDVVKRQLEAVTENLAERSSAGAVLAYEPVWAIGTGLAAEPGQAAEVHAQLRSLWEAAAGTAAELRILYGGSVTPENAEALAREAQIDGALVGGASLDADAFLTICRFFAQKPAAAENL